MPFPTLPNFTPAVPVSATNLNTLVSAADFLYRPPVCVAGTSIAQLVPDQVLTTLILDTEIKDTDNMHSGGTPERFTFQTAGFYLVLAACNWAPSSGGVVRAVEVYLNTATQISYVSSPQLGGALVGQTTFVCRQFAIGDYITVVGFQDSGGILSVTAGLNAVFLAP